MNASDDGPVARTEYTIARIVVFFRWAGLLELLVVAAVNRSNYRAALLPLTALLLVVVAEGVLLSRVCLKNRRVPTGGATADLFFVVTMLVVGAPLADPTMAVGYTVYMMYPFSIITSVAFGACFRHLRSVLGATAVLALGYTGASLLTLHLPTGRLVVDTITYLPNTVVAWAVARQLRETGWELKQSQQREAALVREQERVRHVRVLHDRALQTLETLATGPWIADGKFRAHIAAEAAWLRGFLQDGAPRDEGNLVVALHRLVEDKAREGLRVQFTGTALRRHPVWGAAPDPQWVSVAVDAAREVLTNVAKHAGVESAVMRVVSERDGGLSLSVVDQGRGFDPSAARLGIGLVESVRGRVAEIGGEVLIDTSPGRGTHVEIRLPSPAGRV